MGGGAAGYTAAIYLARANLSPLVLTGSTLEKTRGGRASPDPSHLDEEAEKISAEDKMRAQATRWGARCVDEDVEAVDVEAVDVEAVDVEAVDVEAVDVEAVDATSTPVVISLVGGGEVRCLGAILVGSSVSDACAGCAGRAPESGGVFATDPTAVDERSAGLAAAVDAERWIRSRVRAKPGSRAMDEKAADGNGWSVPDGSNAAYGSGSTMVDGAKLRAAVRGAAGREPAGLANTVGDVSGDDAEEATFDPSQTSHVGQYALRRLYHESDRDALVVLYSAVGCGPCGRLRPIIARVVDEYVDRVHFVEIDVDLDGDVAESAGVLGTPCVHVFRDKERVAVVSGVKTRSKYREAIDSCLRLDRLEEETAAAGEP